MRTSDGREGLGDQGIRISGCRVSGYQEIRKFVTSCIFCCERTDYKKEVGP